MGNEQELTIYNQFSREYVSRITLATPTTSAQQQRYDNIRAALIAELRGLLPEHSGSGTALHFHDLITAALSDRVYEERRAQRRALSNARDSHAALLRV